MASGAGFLFAEAKAASAAAGLGVLVKGAGSSGLKGAASASRGGRWRPMARQGAQHGGHGGEAWVAQRVAVTRRRAGWGLLKEGLSVDAADFDDRIALHLAASEGHLKVVGFLISKDTNVNRADRWGSTPLADARHYDNIDVCKLLEQNGARLKTSSMPVSIQREIPEYEIILDQLVFKEIK